MRADRMRALGAGSLVGLVGVLGVLGLSGCGGGGASSDGGLDARPRTDGTGGGDTDAFGPPVTLAHGTSVVATAGQNFPDPGMILAEGRAYRFSTNGGAGNVPTASADSVDGPWSSLADSFPARPAWALAHLWAPEVIRREGRYYLYYAATVANDGSPFGEHAIGVAEASGPNGPFTAIGVTPLHRDELGRGVIDPDVVEIDGHHWLVWSTDWGPDGRGSGVIRTILARELGGPAELVGSAVELLSARQEGWELGSVEAPALVPGPDGRLHLLYSGGNFESTYATGYAICPRALGPCERVSDEPWLSGTPSNPGGLDVATAPDGTLVGVHHGGPVSLREPYVLPLSWQ